MGINSIFGASLGNAFNLGGNALDVAFDSSGERVFPDIPSALTAYEIFVPLNAPSGYVASSSKNNRGDILNVSVPQFLSLFYDGYLSKPPFGVTVTKTSIGKDKSGLYDIYEYDFCPDEYDHLILLSSGMHTYELPATFGLANFINNLYSADNTDNAALQYIRHRVRVKVVPVVNPWGFNQNPKAYGNVDGVNPNRNFDYNGRWDSFPVYTPSQNEWNVKGAYPFSERETQNLAAWVNSNWNADFWIDCHTDNASAAYDLDVYSLSESKLATQIDNAIDKIRTWFAAEYNVTPVVKHLLDSDGSIRQFWSEYVAGVPTFTLEQSPCRTTFGTSAQNESADIANYCTNISTFVQEFLLAAYAEDAIEIVSATNPPNISINASSNRSAMISGTVLPSNTNQNKFSWVSSDESVCKVYGGTENAIVVATGNGTAILTGTNRYNPSVVITSTVTVSGF